MRQQRWRESTESAWRLSAPVELGDKLNFVPAAFTSGQSYADQGIKITVTGVVTNINYQHRHFTVTYDLYDTPLRESFKF